MAFPAVKTLHTLDEYFALTDHETEIRYEYHFGKIVAMAGAKLRHNTIGTNTITSFHRQLQQRKCRPFNSDSRLRVNAQMWVYPDVMVSCHEEDLKAKLYINHPSLIVEVLSESTRRIDYSLKKQYYSQLPDLQYYIIIETEAIAVDVYERQGNSWVNTLYTEADAVIPLPLLDLELQMEAVYQWVDFEEE